MSKHEIYEKIIDLRRKLTNVITNVEKDNIKQQITSYSILYCGEYGLPGIK